MAIRIGERYDLLAPIGAGGTAVVWRAKDRVLGRIVAVKILDDRLAADADALGRFRREAQTAASFSAPGVVQVHDYGEQAHESGTMPFLVMEHLPGGDLAERLRTRRMPVDEAVQVAKDVLAGLAVIHREGLRHGDVKPGNVLFSRDGDARLADFGISRMVGPEPDAAAPMGTARYVAPEQVESLNSGSGHTRIVPAVDQRSDVYSVGVMMFEALTGEALHPGRTRDELLLAHLHTVPRNPASVDHAVPASLGRWVLRALARDPRARYRDAGEMLAALGEAVEGLSAGPGSNPLGPPTSGDSDLTQPLVAPDEETDWDRTPPAAAPTAQGESRGSIQARPEPDGGSPRPPARRAASTWWSSHKLRDRAPALAQHHLLVDRELVDRYAEQWLRALRDATEQAHGLYWHLPDRIVIPIPSTEHEPAAGWEALLRTVDKVAARRLREMLLSTDSGMEFTIPRLTVHVCAASSPGLEAQAWSSGMPRPAWPGDDLVTFEIESSLRLALEMQLQIRQGTGWRTVAAVPVSEESTFGTDPRADLVFHGPGHDRIAPHALTITFVDGPYARLRVGNPSGITFYDLPASGLGRRLRLRLRRRVAQGQVVTLSPGDRIQFPGAGSSMRVAFE